MAGLLEWRDGKISQRITRTKKFNQKIEPIADIKREGLKDKRKEKQTKWKQKKTRMRSEGDGDGWMFQGEAIPPSIR